MLGDGDVGEDEGFGGKSGGRPYCRARENYLQAWQGMKYLPVYQ